MLRSDTARYRLAAFGLGAVLLLLGGFAVASATATRSAADRLERETSVGWAFERVRSAVVVQDAQIARGAATGDRQRLLADVGAEADRLTVALDEVRRVGTAADRRTADRIAAEEQRLVGALVAGTATDTGPLRRLSRRAAPERATLLGRLASFGQRQDGLFTAMLIVFAAGYALLSLFGGILRRIQHRRLRAEAGRREALEGIAAVAEVTRHIGEGPDARRDVCHAARRIARADVAVLLEPDGTGALVPAADSGLDVAALRLTEPSAAITAWHSGEPRFVADCATDPLVDARVARDLGVSSAMFVPVGRIPRVLGVLVVAWHVPHRALSRPARDTLGLLADEAAVAIDRADLIAQLRASARVDELTGVMSRRAYEEELPRELARARRDGKAVSVARLRLHPDADVAAHKAAAASLRSCLRTTDDVARDEAGDLHVTLWACPETDADLVARRWQDAAAPGTYAAVCTATWDGAEDAGALRTRLAARLDGVAAPVS